MTIVFFCTALRMISCRSLVFPAFVSCHSRFASRTATGTSLLQSLTGSSRYSARVLRPHFVSCHCYCIFSNFRLSITFLVPYLHSNCRIWPALIQDLNVQSARKTIRMYLLLFLGHACYRFHYKNPESKENILLSKRFYNSRPTRSECHLSLILRVFKYFQ